jgi:hypothetical protein
LSPSSPILVSLDPNEAARSQAEKRCRTCGRSLPLNCFSLHERNLYRIDCKLCRAAKTRENNHARGIKRPLSEATETPVWLGVHVAERILAKYFDDVVRMPYGNPGYDYICKRGFKIDAKCSCLLHGSIASGILKSGRWRFHINKNQIADYFLCLAFDSRESLNPVHIWLMPGALINNKEAFFIGNTTDAIGKYAVFEKPLAKVNECCQFLRGEHE